MLRADQLTVVHHDDTTSEFTDVTYTLDRGVRVRTAAGDEKAFADHDVFVIHVRLAHQRTGRTQPTPVGSDARQIADCQSCDSGTW